MLFSVPACMCQLIKIQVVRTRMKAASLPNFRSVAMIHKHASHSPCSKQLPHGTQRRTQLLLPHERHAREEARLHNGHQPTSVTVQLQRQLCPIHSQYNTLKAFSHCTTTVYV